MTDKENLIDETLVLNRNVPSIKHWIYHNKKLHSIKLGKIFFCTRVSPVKFRVEERFCVDLVLKVVAGYFMNHSCNSAVSETTAPLAKMSPPYFLHAGYLDSDGVTVPSAVHE